MRYAIALALFLLVAQACADSWVPAKVAGFASPTGQIVVRVVPGSNLDAVYGFSGSQKGKAATATFYRLNSTANYEKFQEVTLLNPIAPVFAAVADSGELATLDNWHNMGVGDTAVVVYSRDGKILRSYSLADLYTAVEIKTFERSVSSIWWRCSSQPVFEPHRGVLELMDVLGANVSISLKTGAVTRNPTSQNGC